MTKRALSRLRQHPWPGNVRELQNVLARASALAGAGVVDVEHLLLRAPAEVDGSTEPAAACDRPFKAFKADLLHREERRYVQRLMEREVQNITRAARAAGISRTHLLTLLHRHGLHPQAG